MSRPSLSAPARASHLATTTLTKILDLTRLQQQSRPLPSSQTGAVQKSLRSLASLVRTLSEEQAKLQSSRSRLLGEEELKNRRDVVEGLQKQYGRLKALCDGLGIVVEPMFQQAPEEQQPQEQLVDTGDGGDVPLADLPSNGRNTQVPHIKIDMSDEDSETENGGYSISNNGYRHSGDSEDVHMDEEELRQANQDVMQMQQQMMDHQDGQLEQLSKAIARQRDLSLTISSELEIHEGLLEETDQALSNTDSRMRRATRGLDRIRQGTRENSTLTTIGIIIFLLLILIVLIKL